MTDHQIRCFLLAAQTLSFTETAERLHFQPQTVSKNVRALESELGVVLFKRGHNNLELTNGGKYYADRFRKLQNDYRKTVENLRTQYSRRGRTLSIAVSHRLYLGGDLLSAIRSFQTKNPGVHVSGTVGDTTKSVLGKEADIGIIYTQGPVDEANYFSEFVAEEKERLFVSDRVRGIEDGKPYDEQCWDACYIDDHPDNSTSLAAMETVRRRLAMLDLRPDRIDLLPNPRSVVDTFLVSSVVSVAGARFSLLANAHGFRTFELPPPPAKVSLACIWEKTNDNPVIQTFVEHLKTELNRETV